MDKLLLGIDAGSSRVKTFGTFGPDLFRSNVCNWFERKVDEQFGQDDMEFEVNGHKGYAGSIAFYEDEFGTASIYGESKAHNDTKIRVALAIHRYLEKYSLSSSRFSIVVGQPITGHSDEEKNKIKAMLLGEYKAKVNGITHNFTIENVGVGAEGSAAYWSCPVKEDCHIIDLGSGTCNAATIINNRHINKSSDTFNFGAETVNNNDYKNIAHGIIRNVSTLKWDKKTKVYVCGGSAEGIAPYIAEHYEKAKVLTPIFKNGSEVKIYSPIYANAIGNYLLAKGAFG